MAAGPLWRDHGLIFAGDTGAPLDPGNFSRAFAKLCTTAGLSHWHPHELWHSGASLMLAQGTPLPVVSEILGHASITITKDVYGHLVEGDRRAVVASMSQALFGPEPGAVALKMAPKDTEKAPPQSGQEPLTWARSEGLEPQLHRSVDQWSMSGQCARIRSRRSGSTGCPDCPPWSGVVRPVCEEAVRSELPVYPGPHDPPRRKSSRRSSPSRAIARAAAPIS